MKKLFVILGLCLLAFGMFSCGDTPAQPVTGEQQQKEPQYTPEAGWYVYVTNADSAYPQKTYFYMNETGAIERAGNSSNEYTGQQLELLQQQLSYAACMKNADGTTIKFESTTEPEWTKVCPFKEGEYLDVSKHTTFTWPAGKELPLWSVIEIPEYGFCVGPWDYIYENSEGIAILVPNEAIQERLVLDGEPTSIELCGINGIVYECEVYFTVNNSSPIEPENDLNQWGIGYEWWCFPQCYADLGSSPYVYLDGYVLYDSDGNPVRTGTYKTELTSSLYLQFDKTTATGSYSGNCYQITDISELPSWCF